MFLPILRAIMAPTVVLQLLLGWGAVLTMFLASPMLDSPIATPMLFGILAAIVVVIVICAFGVVTHAEHLARRLGDPYGTLVLTLSIVIIEVILISAVMLGPGDYPTIARDSVMAVSMIILNLVIGVALIVGSSRHKNLRPNSVGASSYVSILVVLLAVAFAFPHFLGDNGAYVPGAATVVAILTLSMYGYFLYRQMGPQRADFQDITLNEIPSAPANRFDTSISRVLTQHRGEILSRSIVLVLTVLPIVLLSHDMATLLDFGLDRVGAPVALSGILIAAIVFLPETLTAIRAAAFGEMQRVSNLCHGALISTVGLTIPAVLLIGLFTGQTVILAEEPENLLLLALTMVLTMIAMLGQKVTALHGAAHLMTFVLYLLVMFS